LRGLYVRYVGASGACVQIAIQFNVGRIKGAQCEILMIFKANNVFRIRGRSVGEVRGGVQGDYHLSYVIICYVIGRDGVGEWSGEP